MPGYFSAWGFHCASDFFMLPLLKEMLFSPNQGLCPCVHIVHELKQAREATMTKDEFTRRITSTQGRLYRIARCYLHCEADCLDAVSETILKGWQKLAALRDEQMFDPWLCRILKRECINIQRRQKRMTPVDVLPETTEQPADNTSLRDALDALPQKLRVVTVLYYMEGYDVKDVAAILRIPKGTVTSRLHDARNRLRDILKEEIE
jgi:RNA polymerase sigma-70 factor (ECF subfamily)